MDCVGGSVGGFAACYRPAEIVRAGPEETGGLPVDLNFTSPAH